MHTHAKLRVSAGLQNAAEKLVEWMENTLRRLERSGYMCLYQAPTPGSRLNSAIYNMGQQKILTIRYGCQHPRNCSPGRWWIRDVALLKSKGTVTLSLYTVIVVVQLLFFYSTESESSQGAVFARMCVQYVSVCVHDIPFSWSWLVSLLPWQAAYRNDRNKIIKRVLCSPLMAVTYAAILKGCVIDSL